LGSTSFVESLVVKAFHEDLGMISNFPMLANPQTTFVMLSICYAYCPNYLFCTVFPSLGILQHYAEFDTCTITILEKLLGARSFDCSIHHLARCQTILLTSLNGLGLLFVVQTFPLAFLKCWTLITPALVIRFQ
jgi:hypothetical protein